MIVVLLTNSIVKTARHPWYVLVMSRTDIIMDVTRESKRVHAFTYQRHCVSTVLVPKIRCHGDVGGTSNLPGFDICTDISGMHRGRRHIPLPLYIHGTSQRCHELMSQWMSPGSQKGSTLLHRKDIVFLQSWAQNAMSWGHRRDIKFLGGNVHLVVCW